MLHIDNRTLDLDVRQLPGMDDFIPDTVPKDLMLRRAVMKRAMVDARRCKNAIEKIIVLPKPGESLHFIVDGLFEPCDLIPATRRLSDPAVIKRLDATTLGLNNDNTACIARGMDQGKILAANILVSHYFKSVDKEEYAFLKQEIEQRGGQVNGVRTHCKIILMEMTDGNCFTIEGSGNFRSCQSIEQFVISNDRDLLLFHREWIESYLKSLGNGKDLSEKKYKARK